MCSVSFRLCLTLDCFVESSLCLLSIVRWPCRWAGDMAAAQQDSKESREQFRDVGERAVTAGGLHLAEGSTIWDAYRYIRVLPGAFILSPLCQSLSRLSHSLVNLQSSLSRARSDGNWTAGCLARLLIRTGCREHELQILAQHPGEEQQVQRIRSLYHRQLQARLPFKTSVSCVKSSAPMLLSHVWLQRM